MLRNEQPESPIRRKNRRHLPPSAGSFARGRLIAFGWASLAAMPPKRANPVLSALSDARIHRHSLPPRALRPAIKANDFP
jgi:hypothetical protein